MSSIIDGRVLTLIYVGSRVNVNGFSSVKEMVQHYIAETSMAGAWGSSEHITALCETKALLDRIIVTALEEPAPPKE